jgi:hypothetical protein
MRSRREFVYTFILLLICAHACAAAGVVLKGDLWSVTVQPGTLQVIVQPKGGAPIELSAPQTGLGRVQGVKHSGSSVQWALPDKNVTVSMKLAAGELSVSFVAGKAGSFTWPLISTGKPAKALIWPRWEGCYVPLDNERWVQYLIDNGEWNTLEGLTMPFWGVDYGGRMLTCIITNPCNNGISFAKDGGQLVGRFTHEFTRNNSTKEYGFVIRLTKSDSPVEPARQFRQWLIRNDKFVSMREKLKKTPRRSGSWARRRSICGAANCSPAATSIESSGLHSAGSSSSRAAIRSPRWANGSRRL